MVKVNKAVANLLNGIIELIGLTKEAIGGLKWLDHLNQ